MLMHRALQDGRRLRMLDLVDAKGPVNVGDLGVTLRI